MQETTDPPNPPKYVAPASVSGGPRGGGIGPGGYYPEEVSKGFGI